jgi:hypothetical protein
VFSLFFVVAGAKYGRFFISVTPPFLLLAGHGAVAIAGLAGRVLARATTAARDASAGRTRLAVLVVLALLALGSEARAAVAHAPHYRLYLNALAGGDRSVGWFLPHCDYFDAGMREAVRWVSAHAERGAEVCSEVDWTVRLYAADAGRRDLVSQPLLDGRCCAGSAPCYVVVHAGRLYRHNVAAVERLAARAPEHVETIRGLEAVRVYRLDAGTSPFPPPAPAAGSVSAR